VQFFPDYYYTSVSLPLCLISALLFQFHRYEFWANDCSPGKEIHRLVRIPKTNVGIILSPVHAFIKTHPLTYASLSQVFSSLQVFRPELCMHLSSLVYVLCVSPINLFMFMSMGWDYVSDLRPPTGTFFVPQVTYEYGEPRWNDTDKGNRRNLRKTCPNTTLSTASITLTDPGANPDLHSPTHLDLLEEATYYWRTTDGSHFQGSMLTVYSRWKPKWLRLKTDKMRLFLSKRAVHFRGPRPHAGHITRLVCIGGGSSDGIKETEELEGWEVWGSLPWLLIKGDTVQSRVRCDRQAGISNKRCGDG
jgi:hypothetical protein